MSEQKAPEPKRTSIQMHPSVEKVIEFMECTVQADDLRSVAEAIAILAPALWGHLGKNEVRPLQIKHHLQAAIRSND